MTNKELMLLGMSLDALLEAGEIEKAREIIKVMASSETKTKSNDNKKGQKNNG
ncbi:MAG: hypothetical protein FWD48_07965 [Oscillospiraceae bacterium]|nr:hypothetical protein [Oscillospiraceae bacterium]